MGTASSSAMKTALKRRGRTPIRALGFREFVRKTALLNLGVVLSSLAIGAHPRRPSDFVILLFLATMVSIVAWSVTFAISALVSLSRVFRAQGTSGPRQSHRHPAGGGGVGDPWLDGPA